MDWPLTMKLAALVVLVLLASSGSAQQAAESPGTSDPGRAVARKKRFIAFPKGSSLQMVYCFLTTAYGTPKSLGLFTIGITLGLAWEIPQDPRPFLEQATMGHIQRRHRRDLFPRLESFLDKYGVYGRSCVLRAVCESRQHSKGNGTFIEEIIYTLFSLPLLEEALEDSSSAYDEALQATSCDGFSRDCPHSLLDLDVSGSSKTPKRLSLPDIT